MICISSIRQASASMLRISVTDDGVGIPKEEQKIYSNAISVKMQVIY